MNICPTSGVRIQALHASGPVRLAPVFRRLADLAPAVGRRKTMVAARDRFGNEENPGAASQPAFGIDIATVAHVCQSSRQWPSPGGGKHPYTDTSGANGVGTLASSQLSQPFISRKKTKNSTSLDNPSL